MRPSRRLSLKKETLAELRTDELRQIAGGEPNASGATCDLLSAVRRLSDKFDCQDVTQTCFSCYWSCLC